MTDIENLSKRRAENAGDSRLWTPLDALEDLVADVKAGKLNIEKLVVHFLEPNDSGGYTHGYQVAGVMFPDHISILEVGRHRVIQEWLE